MYMAFDQIMHELIALLVRRLANEDEIKTAMPMLCKLLDVMRHPGTRGALRQHAVFVGFIDQGDSAIGQKIRPVAELLWRHLKNARFCVVEFADIARKRHAA